jgi:hypothetical protein
MRRTKIQPLVNAAVRGPTSLAHTLEPRCRESWPPEGRDDRCWHYATESLALLQVLLASYQLRLLPDLSATYLSHAGEY